MSKRHKNNLISSPNGASAPLESAEEAKSSNAGNDKEREILYQLYPTERKSLIDGENVSADTLDKNILTLSGGALGLSLVFLEKIVRSPKEWTLIFLSFGWLLLVMSLLTMLASFLTSQHAFQRQRQILDIETFPDRHADGKGKLPDCSNVWSERTKRLNWASIICFGVGVLLLCAFSIFNMWKFEPKPKSQLDPIYEQ